MTHNIEFKMHFAVPTTTDATTGNLVFGDCPGPWSDSTLGDFQPAVAAATPGMFGQVIGASGLGQSPEI